MAYLFSGMYSVIKRHEVLVRDATWLEEASHQGHVLCDATDMECAE